MRLEDLHELKAVGRVALSPDGRQVVFELKRADLDENQNYTQLMIVDVAGGEPRALTAAGKHNDLLPKWSPDGTRIGFVSTRDKGATLWVLPMDGGEPRRLTDNDGFVADFAFSPDGRRIAYIWQAMNERQKLERDEKKDELKRRPQIKRITRLQHKLDGEGWWNGQRRHVYVVSAAGGKPKQLTFGDYDDSEPNFSPDGRLVSFTSNRVENPDLYTENADIYVVRVSGGGLKKVTRMPGACKAHTWSPDGKRIAYIGDPAGPGEWWKYNARVWVVDATGGKPREVTREIDQQCVNTTLGDVTTAGFAPTPPLWSRDGERLYFTASEQGATRLFSRSLDKRDMRCEIGGEVNILFAQRTASDGPVALSIGTATNPGDVYLADPGENWRLRRLTHVNAGLLERVEVAEPEAFRVRSDGVEVQGWVLRPPDFDKRRRYPAILEIHGGPHAQYGYSFFHEMQWLAAKGYVVAYANPRGSTGYGLKFMNCTHADWGNLDARDVMKVADWLFSRPYVDPKRVGVTGGSYGGYMTNWLVSHTDRFRAAVTQRSVVNLESLFGTSDFGYDLGHEFGGTPWHKVEQLRRQSPLTYVKNIRTPLLIEHQEQDLRCPIEQAEQLFACLKVLGREVELIRFEGESHGMSRGGRPHNRAERLRAIAGWFDKYMPAGR